MERREFLKNTGIVGAATAAGIISTTYGRSYLHELAPGGRNVSRTTGVPRIPIPSTCMLCNARCGIIGFLEENRLWKIEGNPRDPNSRGKICAVGIAGLQYLYNPERVLYPLKRTGKRGENKWKKISWDEAINEISVKLKTLIDSKKTEQFILLRNFDSSKSITDGFMKAMGNPLVVEIEDLYRFNKKKINSAVFGSEEVIPDIANTKYVLNFGANPYEEHEYFVPFISRLIDSRLDGAKLVTFDSRITNTSGKSSEWYSLTPGSDIYIAMAMINVIMQRGLYNSEFIRRYTDSSAKEISGISNKFSPELAESVSGIKESHIRRIAIEFATEKPAAAISGDFSNYQENGSLTTFAIHLLNIITGNVDSPGGVHPQLQLNSQASKSGKNADLRPELLFYNMSEGSISAEFLLNAHSNPLFTYPDTGIVESVLSDESKLPFHVVADSYMTETARYADIFLPAATYLESWGIHSPVSFELSPQVTLQQPVVSPRGESRQFHKILIDIASHLGDNFLKEFPIDKVDNFIRAEAVKYEEKMKQEGGFEILRETGIWYESFVPNSGNYLKNRKINISSLLKQLSGKSGSLFNRPNSANNEFELLLYQSAVQSNEITTELMWLSEIEHDNFIWINKTSAEKLGIDNKDIIKVISKKNSIVGKARLTNGIHPGAIAVNRNLGHWALGRIARNESFRSDNPNTKIVWWDDGFNQPHPLKLISYTKNDGDGGYIRNNMVRIERL